METHATLVTLDRSLAPALPITEGRYTVRLAETTEEIESALRLRFEVFNLELGEGLASSYIDGLDKDEFDATSEHLVLIETETENIVGTYRLRTLELAGTVDRFYCSTEFEMEALPLDVLRNALEIGRASIAIEHRNSKALYMLWKGLLSYLEMKQKRYLFGPCSLTSQDEREGVQAMVHLLGSDAVHEHLWINARPDYICRVDDTVFADAEFKLPKLFNAYLRFGAKACSTPAIDREFKTIDFLVMFDKKDLGERHRRLFGG